MKKKQKIELSVLLVVILIITLAYYLVGQASDRCTAIDNVQNNCVPMGRCTPQGDPREATVDCALKNYDHKFQH